MIDVVPAASLYGAQLIAFFTLGSAGDPDPAGKFKISAWDIVQPISDTGIAIHHPRGADASAYEREDVFHRFAGTAAPTLDPVDLELDQYRTDRTGGAAVTPIADGYIIEPTTARKFFNGGASCELDAGLIDPREGITIGAVHWPGCGDAAPDQGGPSGPITNDAQQVLGLGGTYTVDPVPLASGIGLEIFFPTSGDPTLRLTGDAGVIDVWSDASLADVQRFIMRLEGDSATVRIAVFVGDQRVDDGTITVPRTALDLTRLSFGDLQRSDGGFHQAVLYARALRDDEIGVLGAPIAYSTFDTDNMDTVAGGGHPGPGAPISDPLLDALGRPAISPETCVQLPGRRGLLRSEHPKVNTRQAAGFTPRVYELRWTNDDGGDYARVMAALAITRSGAVPTRWRSPDDPPGTVDTAPSWIFLEPPQMQRNAAGTVGAFSIVLEEALL